MVNFITNLYDESDICKKKVFFIDTGQPREIYAVLYVKSKFNLYFCKHDIQIQSK